MGMYQNNFLQAIGWSVINSLWQMALLWIIYQLITAVWKKQGPAAKSNLATLLLATGFAWFIYTFADSFFYTGTGNPGVLALAGGPGENITGQWLPFASVIYLLVLVIPAYRFIRNYRYVIVIRKYGLSKMNIEWRLFVQKVSSRMGIRKQVQVFLSEYVASPVIVGFLKPVILLPVAAVTNLNTNQVEAVLLHEITHIRRHDYLVNLVIHFIRTILYFNPFVLAFVKIIEKEREKSCDEAVLQFQYDSFEYASALLTLQKINYLPKQVLSLGSLGKKNDLLHRVERIMGISRKGTVLSFERLAGSLIALFCLVVMNLLLVTKQTASNNTDTFFATITSPAGSLTSGDNYYMGPTEELPVKALEGETPEPIASAIPEDDPGSTSSNENEKNEIAADISPYFPGENEYTYISFPQEMAVEKLEQSKEAQIQKTLAESRRVLENAQWKEMEKRFAEMLTEKEKAALQSGYHKEISKFDWNKWENNLRSAYGNLDWEKVNHQLENALNLLTIDSLHKVYNEAMLKLSEAQKELIKKGVTSIPDTDITLEAIERSKKEAAQSINTLKAIRNKKIVHL